MIQTQLFVHRARRGVPRVPICAAERACDAQRRLEENSACLIKDFGEALVSKTDQAKVKEVIAQRFQGKKPGTIVRNLLTPLTAVLRPHTAKV